MFEHAPPTTVSANPREALGNLKECIEAVKRGWRLILACVAKEFTGHVIFFDSRIDPANQTCKIITEVENRDLLLASRIEARMEIYLEEAPGTQAPNAVSRPTLPPLEDRTQGAAAPR